MQLPNPTAILNFMTITGRANPKKGKRTRPSEHFKQLLSNRIHRHPRVCVEWESKLSLIFLVSDDRNLQMAEFLCISNIQKCLFIEFMLRFVFLDVVTVTFLKVLGEDDISVFSDCLHAGLLTNSVDICSWYFVWPCYVIFQIHLIW